jgi:polar amino acid transport system substrate-binding protein
MFARPHATPGRTARDLTLATAMLAAAAFWAPAGRAADAPSVDQALHDSLPDQYKKNGVKVAAFNDWPPDEFVENGELKGWSIDMAKAMSAKLGVEFHVTGTSFEVIIPGLSSGRFDAGFSSFGVTAERLKALDFIPQRMEGTAYAFLSSKPLTIQKEADLCGHSIAVLTGAWDFQFLTKVSKETCTDKGLKPIDLQQFTTQNAAELAVSSGRVEMTAAGSAKLAYLAKQTGTFSLSELTSNAVYNGIGVRKGDPLGTALEKALQSLMDDGTYKALMAKWGVDKQGMLTKAVLVTEENPDPKQ